MDNRTKRLALATLANAPSIAAAELLKQLTPAERNEALRLFSALGIKPRPLATVDKLKTE